MNIKTLCKRSNDIAISKGFWLVNPDGSLVPRNDGEMLMLMVSELGEALEALRHGNPPSEHIPEFSAIAEELADCCIRIFDYSYAKGIDLDKVLEAKLNFNETRPHMHGGKKF